MTDITLSGWNKGFNEVEFTRFVRDLPGYSPTDAKQVTDTIKGGETVAMGVPEARAKLVLSTIGELGTRCANAAPTH